jgi:hypothetical protein
MIEAHVNSLAELKQRLKRFGTNYLFRGQTRHHTLASGPPSLTTSFARKGCIPPLMLKWIFYATELLRRGGVDIDNPQTMHIVQALLQHYGWRSFYVDLSADQSVASWFAGNVFREKHETHMCEDTREVGVMLVHFGARYEAHNDSGHLYVLDKQQISDCGHELIDLQDSFKSDSRTRFEVQKAWLASCFRAQTELNPRAIVAHISAPGSVFRELAREHEFVETASIFPGPEDDKILANMLSLPWSLAGGLTSMKFYRRSLQIPDYHVTFVKHLPPTTTLYSPFWLEEMNETSRNEVHLHVPEEVFYSVTDIDQPIPCLLSKLNHHNILLLESRNLICQPAVPENTTYDKGVRIERINRDLIQVSSVTVDYPSDQIRTIGVSLGYHYRLDNQKLVRAPSPEDCPCGDPMRHVYHLRAIATVEQLLSEGRARQANAHVINFQDA